MPVTRPGSRSLDAIPGPQARPLIGNLTDIPGEKPIQGLMELSRRFGPIFRLITPMGTRYFISGLEMVDDVCDETRFDKYVGNTQRTLREVRGSAGLITSDTDDPLWHRAHDILLPNFSMRAMHGYLPRMIDIADQLMLKWERVRPDEPVDVVADMTRLTLDTIALCGFGYRLNSYYRDTPHPFVVAMQEVLAEASRRSRSLPGTARLRWRADRRFQENNRLMDQLVTTIIAERRAGGEPGDDLLGHMIAGRDKQGEALPDRNIASQCQTFLIAGHETTSGLLSFVISYLLKRPDVVRRAQDEVDEVLGTDPSVATHGSPAGPTHLRHPDTRRDPALVAHRSGVLQDASRREHGRRVGALHAGHVAAGPHPHAAPSPGGLGRGRRRVGPRPLPPRDPGRAPAQRVQAVRDRAACLHRPPVRDAGGHAGAGDAAAALRVR